VIVNQPNQNRPRKHAGWPCDHDDKCIDETAGRQRRITEVFDNMGTGGKHGRKLLEVMAIDLSE
jgi:hypothetical protein